MADFEDINMDLSSSLQKSDYAQVIFDGTPEMYPTGSDILCCYTVTPLLVPHKDDWVGLYRVGWRSAKDYVHFLFAPMGSDNQKELHHEVSFEASDLPGDDGEFYQFCYVTANGLVRGASTPFQFKSSYHDEFVEVEEEDGELLVVRTRSAVLQEKLNDAALKHSVVIRDVEMLEKERDGLGKKLVKMTEQLKKEGTDKQTLNTKLQEYQEKVSIFTTEAKDMQQVHDNLREKISVLNQEKKCMEKRLDDNDVYLRSLQDKIKTIINEKDSLMGMSKVLEEEKELFKDHFTSSESTIKCYLQESEKLKQQLKEAQLQCSQLRIQTDQLTSELAVERSRSQDMEAVQRSDKERIEGLDEKLHNAEDKLKAAEHCKILLNDEVLNVQEVYKKVSEDLEESKTEAFNLRSQISVKETSFGEENQKMESETHRLLHLLQDMQMEKSLLEDEMKKVRSEVKRSEDKQKSEQSGPMFALQVAHTKLLERLTKMTNRNENLAKKIEGLVETQCAWEEREHAMKSEIRDLKHRLSMGQEEYKTQFIRSQKLEGQIKKISREGSISAERSTENPNNDLEEVMTSEQFTEYEAQNRVTACTLTDASETGHKESQTDVKAKSTVAVEVDLTADALKTQVDKLESQLQKGNNKKHKYKVYWQEEKEKNGFLQKHHYEELKKKDEDIRAVVTQLNATEEASKLRIEKLEKQLKISDQPTSKVSSPPPTEFANPYANYVPSQGKMEEFDPLVSEGLLAPLHPLPPPMTPEMTQGAKVAAIKAKQPGGVGLNGILELCQSETVDPSLKAPSTRAETAPVGGNADADADDEPEFVDAQGEPQKTCPICSIALPVGMSDADVASHIDEHYGPECPICHEQFEKGTDIDVFQGHVENHFD